MSAYSHVDEAKPTGLIYQVFAVLSAWPLTSALMFNAKFANHGLLSIEPKLNQEAFLVLAASVADSLRAVFPVLQRYACPAATMLSY